MKSIKNKLMISLVAFFALSFGISTVYAMNENAIQADLVAADREEDFTKSGDWNTFRGTELTLGQALEVFDIYKICYKKPETELFGLIQTTSDNCLLDHPDLIKILTARKKELNDTLTQTPEEQLQKCTGLNKQIEVINSILETQEDKKPAFISTLKDNEKVLKQVICDYNVKLQMVEFYGEDAASALKAEDLTLTDINKNLKKHKPIINKRADQVKYELLVHAISLIGMNTILKNHVKEENIKNLYIFYAFVFTLYEAAKKYRLNKIHEKFTSTSERVKEFLRCFLQESSHFSSMIFIIALNKCLSEEQKESIKKIINAKTLAGTAIISQIMGYLSENDFLQEKLTPLLKFNALKMMLFNYTSQGPLFVENNKEFMVSYAKNFIVNKTTKKIWHVIGQKFLNDDVSINLQSCHFMSSLFVDLSFSKQYFNHKGAIVASVIETVEDYVASAKTRLQEMKAIADNFVAST